MEPPIIYFVNERSKLSLISTNIMTYMSVKTLIENKWVSFVRVRVQLMLTLLRHFDVIYGNISHFKPSQRCLTWFKVVYNIRAIWDIFMLDGRRRFGEFIALNHRRPSRMKSLHFALCYNYIILYYIILYIYYIIYYIYVPIILKIIFRHKNNGFCTPLF